MDKVKLNKWLNFVKYSAMVLFVIGAYYVFFIETENFCVEVGGKADDWEKGSHCFKSIGEANEFKLYLIDKYKIGEDNFNYDMLVLPNLTVQ